MRRINSNLCFGQRTCVTSLFRVYSFEQGTSQAKAVQKKSAKKLNIVTLVRGDHEPDRSSFPGITGFTSRVSTTVVREKA